MREAQALGRLKTAIDRDTFLEAHGFKFVMLDGEMHWLFSSDRSVGVSADYVETADELEWELKVDFIRAFTAAFADQATEAKRDRVLLIRWAEFLRTLQEPVMETVGGNSAVQAAMFDITIASEMVHERAATLANAPDAGKRAEEALPC